MTILNLKMISLMSTLNSYLKVWVHMHYMSKNHSRLAGALLPKAAKAKFRSRKQTCFVLYRGLLPRGYNRGQKTPLSIFIPLFLPRRHSIIRRSLLHPLVFPPSSNFLALSHRIDRISGGFLLLRTCRGASIRRSHRRRRTPRARARLGLGAI